MQQSKKLELIWGVKDIAAALNISDRRAFYLVENGRIPARKEGRHWVTSRQALRKHFADILTDGEAA